MSFFFYRHNEILCHSPAKESNIIIKDLIKELQSSKMHILMSAIKKNTTKKGNKDSSCKVKSLLQNSYVNIVNHMPDKVFGKIC